MKACFADDAEHPSACAWDIDEVHNCLLASRGVPRTECQYWQPERAVTIAREILGIEQGNTRKCFSLLCEKHFPPRCRGTEYCLARTRTQRPTDQPRGHARLVRCESNGH